MPNQTIIGIAMFTVLAWYLLRRNGRGSSESSANQKAATLDPGEGALNRVLAGQLGRKTGIAEGRIFSVLQGVSDADLQRRIDASVKDVKVTYSRRSASDAHEASVRIAYLDGSTTKVEYTASWDQLPNEVRAEVLRTGKSECVRSWAAPWRSEVA